jgi:heme oxygenase (biliverdin-IX-beta and delta-forming)
MCPREALQKGMRFCLTKLNTFSASRESRQRMTSDARPGQTPVLVVPAREHLRAATARHHARIEGVMNLDTIAHQEMYHQLLLRMLAFYRPMEAALAQIAWDGLGLNSGERRKTPLLVRDLLAIGILRQHLTRVPDAAIPEFAGRAGALGCCYVLEGATLGGQLIARRLKTVLDLDQTNGAAFFSGYGRSTGAKWRSFCAVLNAKIKDPASYQAAAAAACATFECLEACLTSASVAVGHAGTRM